MLCALAGGETSVSELEAFQSQRQSTASQRLARLRRESLAVARRYGAPIYCRLANEKVGMMLAAVRQTFCEPQGDAGVRVRVAPAAINRWSPSSTCRSPAS